jgi:hypothetical protein
MTVNAYAATVFVNLIDADIGNAADFQAVVNNDQKPFDANGQAVFTNVDVGSYTLDIQNLQGQDVSFSISDANLCDFNLPNEQASDTCNIDVIDSLNNEIGSDFGISFDNTTNSTQKPPAKFNVKTVISDECLSSSPCSTVEEKDVNERVFMFSSSTNKHSLASSFPGSNLSRQLVFDNDYDFMYGPIQLEVDAEEHIYPKHPAVDKPIWIKIEYHSCSIYLNAGEVGNCIVTIKPITSNIEKTSSNLTNSIM